MKFCIVYNQRFYNKRFLVIITGILLLKRLIINWKIIYKKTVLSITLNLVYKIYNIIFHKKPIL